MAGPGDPKHFDDHDDDLIGFASPASLQGRARDAAPPEPEAAPVPLPTPNEPAPDLFSQHREPEIAPAPEPVVPSWGEATVETPGIEAMATDPVRQGFDANSALAPMSERTTTRTRRRVGTAALPGGGMRLFAIYALILFAVPTLGVSVVIGLFAVSRRDGPEDTLSRSHFIFQQRTLRAAALVAAAGLVLLAAPLALGVPILFGLALWLVVRGASGVWALKAGRPIADPRDWWI